MAPPTEKPLTAMTVLELTRLVGAQDDRWANLLTYAQSTHNPAAPGGIAFFKKTWRPAFGSYYENVVARYDPAAKAPRHIINWLLDLMTSKIYPAARQVGFTERSFLFPDIVLETEQPTNSAVATLGAEASARDGKVNVGTTIAFAALALGAVGLAVYARDVRKLARAA